MMDHISEEKMVLWLNFLNECSWQYCEKETRRRGFFVKQVNIPDVRGVTMSMSTERRFFNALGRSSAVNEWLRPQLIGKTIVLNPPRLVKLMFNLASAFMSKKSIEKVLIHKHKVARPSRDSSQLCLCPFAELFFGGVDTNSLPSFIGGTGCSENFPERPSSVEDVPEDFPLLLAIAHMPLMTDDLVPSYSAPPASEGEVADVVPTSRQPSTGQGFFSFYSKDSQSSLLSAESRENYTQTRRTSRWCCSWRFRRDALVGM
uniref:CRAL-TRIO domain-containing protein n=1 Tax=Noctiluca scintillans TaxID=2966 RepID=A0A7S1A7Z5_NOCSC|mmetsp:Transcript_35452/g.94353  ORF Transcript_35452/g.94353 Transcript_35452/m.94353 type:complete len:260 (+) Transcript_35452:497-1276(+)